MVNYHRPRHPQDVDVVSIENREGEAVSPKIRRFASLLLAMTGGYYLNAPRVLERSLESDLSIPTKTFFLMQCILSINHAPCTYSTWFICLLISIYVYVKIDICVNSSEVQATWNKILARLDNKFCGQMDRGMKALNISKITSRLTPEPRFDSGGTNGSSIHGSLTVKNTPDDTIKSDHIIG